jgi:hypothetical protein
MHGFHRIAITLNLVYWIDGGTSLGATRHKGLIPWDDDLDVCVEKHHFISLIQEVQQLLAEEGFLLCSAPGIGWCVNDPTSGTSLMDIFSMKLEDNKYFYGEQHDIMAWGTRDGMGLYYTVEEVNKRRLVEFGGREVYQAHQPEKYFVALYGEDWNEVGYVWQHGRGETVLLRVDVTLPQWRLPAADLRNSTL